MKLIGTIKRLLHKYEPTKSLLIKYHKYDIGRNPRLDRVTIDISNECNASCPFCNRQVVPENRLRGLMSKEMFYSIMTQIEEIPTVTRISLTAFGEPMLHPDFDEFVDYIKSKNYSVWFATNMSVADKHFDTMLKVDNIMFSIEGHDQESYEKSRVRLQFDKVYSNVVEFDKLVKKHRANKFNTPKREINYLVDKDSEVSKFVGLWGDYVDEIGVRPIFSPLYWNGSSFVQRTPDELKDKLLPLNNKIKNMFCFQPFISLNIRANGEFALCCSDYNGKLDLGDHRSLYDSFTNNANYKAVRSEFINKKLKVCKGCFQNYEVDKETLYRELPDLIKYKQDERVVIYANR